MKFTETIQRGIFIFGEQWNMVVLFAMGINIDLDA